MTGTIEVKILDINEEWIQIEYERRKEGTAFQKEKVVKLVDLSLIAGRCWRWNVQSRRKKVFFAQEI